jgi:hypothetical protein
MTYTPEMLEMIKVVEASRQRRLKEIFPSMSMEDRERVLKGFHPDYIQEGMRAIRVGVCKGDRTPNELADVLEGPASYLA